ncbi:MAG TPA: hypothetical protein VHN82_08760 [Methanoregula sp.]|nr:hypothetical protein [Methanoregula sp.]
MMMVDMNLSIMGETALRFAATGTRGGYQGNSKLYLVNPLLFRVRMNLKFPWKSRKRKAAGSLDPHELEELLRSFSTSRSDDLSEKKRL